jgi:hypothetical protein
MIGDVYYLGSLESARFATVRECRVVDMLVFDTGKVALVAKIDPPIIGQGFNRPDDLETVILAARHEGVSLDPVSEFPCFVFIAITTRGYELKSPIRSADLSIIGWGELYRTYHDAEHHIFG